MAGSLRKAAVKLGITGLAGTAYRKGAARACVRWTRAQVAVIALAYRPRRDLYKQAAARLLLAA